MKLITIPNIFQVRDFLFSYNMRSSRTQVLSFSTTLLICCDIKASNVESKVFQVATLMPFFVKSPGKTYITFEIVFPPFSCKYLSPFCVPLCQSCSQALIINILQSGTELEILYFSVGEILFYCPFYIIILAY